MEFKSKDVHTYEFRDGNGTHFMRLIHTPSGKSAERKIMGADPLRTKRTLLGKLRKIVLGEF